MTDIARTLDAIADEELVSAMLTPGPLGIFLWAGIIVLCEMRRG